MAYLIYTNIIQEILIKSRVYDNIHISKRWTLTFEYGVLLMIDREKAMVVLLGMVLIVTDAAKALPGILAFGLLTLLEPIFAVLVPVMWISIFCGACMAIRTDKLWLELLGLVVVWALILLAIPLLRYPRNWWRNKQAKKLRVPIMKGPWKSQI